MKSLKKLVAIAVLAGAAFGGVVGVVGHDHGKPDTSAAGSVGVKWR